MLKLKAPIQLHTVKSLCNSADAFAERIKGNYSLLGAHFTPKDLLFLLTAPPELPENLGGMTTLVSQQSNVDMSSISVDVISNVVNRIMLDGTSSFTYQDQVYITSVLNRLGIVNAEQFMTQIRRLKVENENTVHMTRLYRTELKRILQRIERGESDVSLPVYSEAADAEGGFSGEDPRVTMCMNILKRLETSRIYETVHSFQQNQTFSDNYFSHNEMRLSEHLRFGNTIELSEIKKQMISYPKINLAHHVNQYETGILLEAPRDEDEVLSQAAVAALVTTIDNTVTEVLNRHGIRRDTWVNIQNAVRQSAENTLSRFESYHSEMGLVPAREIPESVAWDRFAGDMLEYQNFYQTVHKQTTKESEKIRFAPRQKADITYLTQPEEENNIFEQTQTNISEADKLRETIVRETQKAVVEQNKRRLQYDNITEEAKKQSEIVSSNLTYLTNVREENEFLKEADKNTVISSDAREKVIREIVGKAEKSVAKNHSPEIYRDIVMQKLLHIGSEQTHNVEEIEVHETISEHEREIIINQMLMQKDLERPTSPSIPPVTLTPREAEEQAPEILIDELNRINEKNLIVMQQLQQQIQQRELPKEPVPDVARTMRDALKALEPKGEDIHEIYTSHEEVQTVHPKFTAEEEAILAQADPSTRALYEQILSYQKSPDAVLSQGILRPGNMGALQADIKRAIEDSPAVMEHIEKASQTEKITDEAEIVLEKFIHSSKTAKTYEKPRLPHKAIEIVHKQAPPDITEELLEQLEENKLQKSIKSETSETVNRETSHQIDVKQVEKQLVTRTNEDITELVNRTLARQMRTISDQVYRQMEKRLQTERSRRGRL